MVSIIQWQYALYVSNLSNLKRAGKFSPSQMWFVFFCNALSTRPPASAAKPQEDEILSAGCTLRNLYLKTRDRPIVCFIYLWRCVMYCWRQRSGLLRRKANSHLRQLRLAGSHTVKTRHVNTRDTQWRTQTHTHIHKYLMPLCLFPFSDPFSCSLWVTVLFPPLPGLLFHKPPNWSR